MISLSSSPVRCFELLSSTLCSLLVSSHLFIFYFYLHVNSHFYQLTFFPPPSRFSLTHSGGYYSRPLLPWEQLQLDSRNGQRRGHPVRRYDFFPLLSTLLHVSYLILSFLILPFLISSHLILSYQNALDCIALLRCDRKFKWKSCCLQRLLFDFLKILYNCSALLSIWYTLSLTRHPTSPPLPL